MASATVEARHPAGTAVSPFASLIRVNATQTGGAQSTATVTQPARFGRAPLRAGHRTTLAGPRRGRTPPDRKTLVLGGRKQTA